jgi:YHS domain-containing protein
MTQIHKVSLWPAILPFFFSLILATGALAAKPEVYTSFGSNLAVGGYDPVAYFEKGAPIKGSKSFSYEFRGATWQFSTQQNLDLFMDAPEEYAPRYGGYCAWAMATGKLAKGDPKVWHIAGGQLYLNVNKSTQKKWLKDVPGFIEKADAYWPGILEK